MSLITGFRGQVGSAIKNSSLDEVIAKLEQGATLIDQGKLRFEVSKVLPLAEAAAAHTLVEEGHTTGKVILRID